MIYDYKIKDIEGNEISMEKYRGKVLLIVNTATKCGFTPQYTGLQEIYEDLKDRGLEILDFPCNQFANEAPESNEEIKNFCTARFGITFPQFEKIDVNGDNAHPLYKFLRSQKSGILGDKIKWNFTKFLVDRQGNVIERFAPISKPEDIKKDIEKLL